MNIRRQFGPLFVGEPGIYRFETATSSNAPESWSGNHDWTARRNTDDRPDDERE